jgi:hypothetical protein
MKKAYKPAEIITLPKGWRVNFGRREAECPHGVGHPVAPKRPEDAVHSCDGCCAVLNTKPKGET